MSTGDGVRWTFSGEILIICSIDMRKHMFYHKDMNEVSRG